MSIDPTGHATLGELTRRMAVGDDEAWASFHRHYGPTLFRMLLALTAGDTHLASEALQHAYLRISRHVRPCDNEAMWIAWLRVVAKSALTDARRKESRFFSMLRRRWLTTPLDVAPLPKAESAAEDHLLAALDQALTELPEATRHLISAKYLGEQTVEQIAAREGLSDKAVESRLTRARQELRERVKQILSRHD